MLDRAKGFYDTQGVLAFSPASEDGDKCFRDSELINEAGAYDMVIDSNFRSIK